MENYENFDGSRYSNEESVKTPSDQSETQDLTLKTVINDQDFGTHLRVYGVIIGILALIDLSTGRGLWFQYPALAWGIGLSCHFFETYFNLTEIEGKYKDLKMHGAVTGTLIAFFFLMDLFTSARLNWWYWPSIFLFGAWLIHRATVFTPSGDPREKREDTVFQKQLHPKNTQYCSNCGNIIQSQYLFCQFCGKKTQNSE